MPNFGNAELGLNAVTSCTAKITLKDDTQHFSGRAKQESGE